MYILVTIHCRMLPVVPSCSRDSWACEGQLGTLNLPKLSQAGNSCIPSVSKKYPPLKLFGIFSLRLSIFAWNFFLICGSCGAKGEGAAGARAPAVKLCAPAVPRHSGSWVTVTLTINDAVRSEQAIILKTLTMMLSGCRQRFSSAWPIYFTSLHIISIAGSLWKIHTEYTAKN